VFAPSPGRGSLSVPTVPSTGRLRRGASPTGLELRLAQDWRCLKNRRQGPFPPRSPAATPTVLGGASRHLRRRALCPIGQQQTSVRLFRLVVGLLDRVRRSLATGREQLRATPAAAVHPPAGPAAIPVRQPAGKLAGLRSQPPRPSDASGPVGNRPRLERPSPAVQIERPLFARQQPGPEPLRGRS